MRYFHFLVASLAIVMAFQTSANAQQCTAHYTFDRNISDSSSAGLSAYLADATKAAGSVEFAEGKFGQALVLDRDTVLRLPIELSIESCPQFTMTESGVSTTRRPTRRIHTATTDTRRSDATTSTPLRSTWSCTTRVPH